MIIRRAVLGDIPHLLRLLSQVLEIHHKGRPDIFKSGAVKYTSEELSLLLCDSSRPVFVAEDEQSMSILGYCFCIFKEERNNNILTGIKTLYIDDLCVDENARGQHIGTILYNHVVEFAKTEGCYNITLNVWALNEDAIAFYERLGLVPQKIGMEKIL